MYCQKCGKELPDDTKFCHFCGAPQSTLPPASTAAQKAETNAVSSVTPQKKSHGFLIFLIVAVILGVCIFGIVKFVQYQQTEYDDGRGTIQGNHDGDRQLFKRSASSNDISVDSDLDLTSFGGKYTVLPQTDIDGLELTIHFLDSNRSVLQSVVKSLGNVKKGVQVSFSISLFDLGVSVAWNTKYESIVVTGGTVSYFA